MNRNGEGAKPNVMLTLDVSGSMSAQHMPEGVFFVGAHIAVSPPGARFTRLHPDDGGVVGADGPIPAVPGGRDYYSQQFLRSPETNALYYNPEIRYLPWIQVDGSRYGNADPAKARLDPNDSTKTVDLTKVEKRNTSWCTYLSGPGKECSRMNLDYSPALYYRLKKPAGAYADPQVAANYDEFDLNATGNPTFRKYPARADCAGAACTQDEERRNFANWFVYHRSRLLLAKAALGEALQGMPDAFRLGYGRTDLGPRLVDGIKDLRIVESGVRDFNADRKAAVMAWLYGLYPAGSTPLRLAISEVGRYYSSKLASGPWSDTPGSDAVSSHQACRRAYHVLMTDGYWNDGTSSTGMLKPVGNVDGSAGPVVRDDIAQRDWQYQPAPPFKDDLSDSLADYAMHFWSRDLRDDLPNTVPPSRANPATWQSMTNFTVGLGVRGKLDPKSDLPALIRGDKSWGTDKIDDLWHAAVNSRGGYFNAQSAEQLRVALESAMRSAVERELPEAGIATSSATLETGSRTYIPRYRSGVWTGDVEAYALDAQGKPSGAALWSARDQLPLWTKRRLFTWEAAKGGVAFEWNSLGAATRNAINADWRGAALVDFIRGDRSSEEAPRHWRVRESLLGDFINSAPVFAKGGSDDTLGKLPDIGASYRDHVKRKAGRPGVLYVGGNGGMLHAFRDTLGAAGASPDGEEMFAYVPAAVVPKLHILAQRSYGSASNFHQYYVDGPLREADVHVPAPGADKASWRNYLFGSTGAGARSVFALDITDPEAFGATSVRWEINSASQPELGHVLAPVAHGQLPNGKWVALFGNGLGGQSGKPSLFVVDVETGAVTRVQPDTPETDNGLGGVAVRRDGRGQVVALYAGDLAGNLWRFDYDAEATGWFKVGNGGKPIFQNAVTDPGKRQAIVQAPLVFDQKAGGHLVVFATGRLITTDDANNLADQAVYGVWDRAVQAPQGKDAAKDLPKPSITLKPADLAVRTLGTVKGTGTRSEQLYFTLSGEKIDWAQQGGWVIKLGGVDGYAGLRVLFALQLVRDRVVLVSAVAPGGAVTGCDASTGKGVNLLVPIDTGAGPSLPYFDTNGDGAFNSTDAKAAGYATSSDGADAVVHGKKPAATGDSTGGEPTPDPIKGEKAKPACGSGPVYLVGGYATHAACLQSRLAIIGRLWRRVMAPPF